MCIAVAPLMPINWTALSQIRKLKWELKGVQGTENKSNIFRKMESTQANQNQKKQVGRKNR